MASVDNRIVNMTFNNADFESRISSTIQSLKSLDKTIAEVGTKGGLQNLAAEANKFSLDGMTSAIEGVSAKFLAMSTIGITALANLTNKAIDAGIQIAKSLAVEPISQGFGEYELKLGAIQTIMAGSGADLETVNKKLKELNDFSDKTIYSFADMTQNIGKFTNAGVDLDTSVKAIQGVATAAGLSGANAEEASRAMYNFAQALSKGSVGLVDWKSIELANMATDEFKQQLIDSAVATGTLTKEGEKYRTEKGTLITTTENFNDSLQEEWLTTEALTTTLGRYADETTDIGKRALAASSDIKTFSQLMDVTKESVGSGWAQSFEILFGGFEDAKHLWGAVGGAITDFVNKSSDKRNKFLQDWRDLGGQMELFAGLYFAFQNLKDIIQPVIDAFREIFPPMTAERAYELSKAFRLFMENLKPSEKTVENIGRIFKGLFNILDIGWEILKTGVRIVKDFIDEFTGIGEGGTLDFLAKIGDVLAALDAETIIGAIGTAFNKLGEIFRNPIPYILALVDTIKGALANLASYFENPMPSVQGFIDKIGEFFSSLASKMPDLGGPLGGAADKIKEVFGGIGEALSSIDLPNISFTGILNAIGGAIGEVIDKITGFFSSGGEMATTVQDAAGGIDWNVVMAGVGLGMVGGLIATVNRLISNGINIDFTGGVLSSISETFGQLTGVLKTMQNDIKSDILLKIAGAIGVLALSMIALSFIDAEDLAKSLAAMAVGLGQLVGVLAVLNKIEFGTADAAKFTLLAISFGILAGGMVLLAIAVGMFADLDWEELGKGGAAFAVVVASIIVMSHMIENQAAGMVKAAFAMLLMAVGMGAMAKSISKFGEMDTHVLVQGMIGLASAMALLVGTMQLLPDNMQRKTAGLLGFSVALNLMVLAIKQLGGMNLGDLVQGGVAFALMLAGLVVAMNMMPNNMAPKAAQLLGLAGAMLIMSMALKIFASMSFGDMIQGLAGMAAALVILVVAMDAASGGIAGSLAMIVMAGAMLMLAAAIRAFAALSLEDFAKGLVLMAGAITALSLVALALAATGALEALLVLGLAMAAIGLGVAAVGFGIAQVAKGIAILASIGPEGAKGLVAVMEAVGQGIPAIFTGLAKGIGEFVEVLIGFIPVFVEFGVKLISALIEGFITILPLVYETITTVILGVLGVIEELIPAFITTGLNILLGVLQGISEAVPQIVTVVGEIITGFLDALAEQIPGVVTSVTNLFATMITSVAQALGFLIPTLMISVGTAFLQGFIDGVTQSLGKVWDLITSIPGKIIELIKNGLGINSPSTIMIQIGTDLIQGFIDGVLGIIDVVWDFFSKFAGEIFSKIGETISTIYSKGWDIIQGFINGYVALIGTVTTFFTGLGSDVIEWVGSLLDTLWDAGWDLIMGLWNGLWEKMLTVQLWFENLEDKVLGWIGDTYTWLKTAGINLVIGLWNGIAEKAQWLWDQLTSFAGKVVDKLTHPWEMLSPSKVMIEKGQFLIEGLAIGIKNMEPAVAKSIDGVNAAIAGGIEPMFENLSDVLSKVSEDLSSSVEFNPVITPVLDLSSVTQGSKEMASLLATNSYAQANTIASTEQNAEDALAVVGSTEIKFEQTIHSPTALSTADIYRQTRNQVALAKEELSIP